MSIRNRVFFPPVLLPFSSPSGYTIPHHHRYRCSPAWQQRAKNQNQPFPSVFHRHALKIAPKQLHHRPLNKWICTLLKAFSWRHSATWDSRQSKVWYTNAARLLVKLTQRPFAGSSPGHRSWAREGRVNTKPGTEHLIPLPSSPQTFPTLPPTPVQSGVRTQSEQNIEIFRKKSSP